MGEVALSASLSLSFSQLSLLEVQEIVETREVEKYQTK